MSIPKVLLLNGLLALAATRTLAAYDSTGGNRIVQSPQYLPPQPEQPQQEEGIIKQVMLKDCRGQYSSHCLKLGLLRLVSRTTDGSVSLLPGVSLSWVRPELQLSQDQLEDPDSLDGLLLDQLGETLSNVSLSVKLLDKGAPMSFARAYLGDSDFIGRKKNQYGGALAAAGLMSGGTMLAVGMSALAAMAGKALMASLLALMLAGIAALRGNNDGDSKTTYEIVAKPVVSHQHSHSSEVVHGGHHYKRSIPAQHLAYMMQIPK